jgi:hypothetical protein
MTALAKVAALFDPPFEPLAIPFEGHRIPSYFISAPQGGRRPLLIPTNGYDATVLDIALAARARGYRQISTRGADRRSGADWAVQHDEADERSST